jgi:O-antigen/teichoic acid export membrane protein
MATRDQESVALPPQAGAEAVVIPPDPAPLARQTLAYGLTGLISPIAGLITLPIFARVFSHEQYGIIELGTAISAVAITLSDAGFSAATLRSFYDYGDDEEEQRRAVLTTGFASTTFLGFLVGVLMIVFRKQLSQWLFGSTAEETLLVVMAGSLLVTNIWRMVSEVMRVRLMAFRYLATAAIAAAVTTAIGVTGVVVLGWRVTGVFLAALIGNSVAAVYGLSSTWRSFLGRYSRYELGRMLRYGLPFVPAALAAWMLALVDRIILTHLGSLSQVGQYAIANRFSNLLMIGMGAFLFALTPYLFSLYAQDPELEKAARARVLTYLTFVLTLGGLALTLFAKELIQVLAPSFNESYKAVGPLVFGMVAFGLSTVLATGMALARTTLRGAFLVIGAAAINIGLNFALIPSYGIVGAGIATAVGYGLLSTSYYLVSQHVYHTQYESRKVLMILALATALGAFGVIPLGPAAVAVPLKLVVLIVFVAGVRVTGAITRVEFAELRKFVQAMIPLPLGRARA